MQIKMFGATEDEEYFNPSTSSNLASLFGTSTTLQNNNEPNLSYTAPKQPKVQDKNSKPQSTVLCSKFVDAFKLVDNEHVNQGKCGIAIIGNESLNVHEIILYKSKQDIITRSKLKVGFVFHKQNNNFASFCDDQQQRWSVHFENIKEIEGFSKEIKLYGGQIVQTETKVVVVEQKQDSDSFSDTSTNKAKASILSRMAKMGQSVIPKSDLPPSESDNSDSDEKTVIKKNKKVRQPKEKTLTDQTVNLPMSQSEFVIINGKPVPISALQQNFNIPAINQPFWGHPQPISEPLNIFIAENRTHNCEMRMNISQLSLKLDKIFEEVSKTKPVLTNALYMNEVNQKMTNKEDVLRKLEDEHKTLQNKLKTANEVISDLTIENESYRLNISKQEEIINNVQEEKTKNVDLKAQIEKQRVIMNELEETIANQKPKLEMLTQFYEERKNSVNYSEFVEELNASNDKLKTKLADKAVKRDLFSKKLMKAMNSLYQTMMETFSDENVTFGALEIKEVVSKNLKTTTFNIIEEFNTDFKDDEDVESISLSSVPN